MLDTLQKTYSHFVLKPYLHWYLKKKRAYAYENLHLTIYPSVFHPKYFFSTEVLLKFIKKLPLKGSNFCEPGAGSGLISLCAFNAGANVICFDTNENAVAGLKENFENNFHETAANSYQIYHSDLFDKIPSQTFDFILINPPYYFADAINPIQQAWYCGKNGEYFEKLFSQLKSYSNAQSQIYMILAGNCETGRIQQIANNHHIVFHLIHQEKVKWENNCIFKLTVN